MSNWFDGIGYSRDSWKNREYANAQPLSLNPVYDNETIIDMHTNIELLAGVNRGDLYWLTTF